MTLKYSAEVIMIPCDVQPTQLVIQRNWKTPWLSAFRNSGDLYSTVDEPRLIKEYGGFLIPADMNLIDIHTN